MTNPRSKKCKYERGLTQAELLVNSCLKYICQSPNDLLKESKYIADLVKQTSKVGELRGPLQAGVMTVDDVYCELGDLVNGKPGRENDQEIIVVDLTGTGAQDAAIGQVAWDKLSKL